MAQRNTILTELMEISLVVAKLPGQHPFTVPAGYFEQLPLSILQVVNPAAEDPDILQFGRGNVDHPYAVPDGYFDRLAGEILNRVQAAAATPSEELERISPVLSKLDKKAPFTVPEGYFTEMPSNVIEGINAIDFVQAELEIVPSQLLEMKKKNVFSVPSDYFEKLPAQILKRVNPTTRVLSFYLPTRLVRYAAAAVVIGIMAIGFLFFNKERETYVALNSGNAELDSSLKRISDAEIKSYVENSTTLPDPTNISGGDLQQQDMKDMLADVSDKDIESYLEQYGISKENLTN